MSLDDEDDQKDGTVESFEDDDDSGVEDTDDGGAIIKVDEDDTPTADEDDFYRNLAEELPESDLANLCQQLIELIDLDKKSRKPRDEKYTEGIMRTGLGDEAPGGEAFTGASKVVHPMLSKATVYYQSHTIGELFPPMGPVRDDIIGTPTPARVEKAKRKVAHMNWQFKYQMPESRNEFEKMLSQQPLGGSQYQRLVYDSGKKRPIIGFIPIDKVWIPEAASDFYTAERRTFEDTITQVEFENRTRSGYYRLTPTSPPSMSPEKTRAKEATDKVEGVDQSASNTDGLRAIYIIEALASVEDTDDIKIAGMNPRDKTADELAEESSGPGPLPYLIEVDPYQRKILRMTRNWEPEDKQHQNMCWMVDFPFIPWRGPQSVGLIHLMGSLAGAGTGSLRALLDAALVNNTQTAVMLKGANAPGQNIELSYGNIATLEGGIGRDVDIRKVLMPLPFNPPSQMLYELLGWCTDQGEQVVRTTFENLSEDGSPNMPVGTTLALIEQGLKVLSAIHGRLHNAMNRLIGVLHRINRLYITDDDILDDAGEVLAHRSDYEGPVDVVPVSDPQTFSDVQRFAQMQVIQQRSDLHPDLYDARKVEELILERTKVPNAKDLLKPIPQVHELNQVNENLAMVLGRPVAAFPEQNHEAHIQVLLDFGQSPLLGQLPTIAPKFWGPALQHLTEHLLYWYVTHFNDIVSKAAGGDVGKMMKIKDPSNELGPEIDKALATASPQIVKAVEQMFAKVPPIVQQALQLMQKSQQSQAPGPADPTAMGVAQIGAQVKQADIASKEKLAQAKMQSDSQNKQGDAQSRLQQTELEQQGDEQRTQEEIAAKEQINREDNATALDITAAKVATGHSTNVSTGTGIGGDTNPGVG